MIPFSRVWMLVLLTGGGCKRESDAAPPPVTPPSNSARSTATGSPRPALVRGPLDLEHLPCLAPDSGNNQGSSVAFGESAVDSVLTQDVAGFIVYLRVRGSQVEVLKREAAGEWGSPESVDSASVDFASSALNVKVDEDYRFNARFTCDSLWGEQTLYGNRKHFVWRRVAG